MTDEQKVKQRYPDARAAHMAYVIKGKWAIYSGERAIYSGEQQISSPFRNVANGWRDAARRIEEKDEKE